MASGGTTFLLEAVINKEWKEIFEDLRPFLGKKALFALTQGYNKPRYFFLCKRATNPNTIYVWIRRIFQSEEFWCSVNLAQVTLLSDRPTASMVTVFIFHPSAMENFLPIWRTISTSDNYTGEVPLLFNRVLKYRIPTTQNINGLRLNVEVSEKIRFLYLFNLPRLKFSSWQVNLFGMSQSKILELDCPQSGKCKPFRKLSGKLNELQVDNFILRNANHWNKCFAVKRWGVIFGLHLLDKER